MWSCLYIYIHQVCRKMGIRRWPCQTLKPIDRRLQILQKKVDAAHELGLVPAASDSQVFVCVCMCFSQGSDVLQFSVIYVYLYTYILYYIILYIYIYI